ncbi:MAG TPA: zinc-dependent metalloprotease, partial [Telluria sp.]
AYAQFAPSDEAGALTRLRAEAKAAGLAHVSDNEARNAGSMHPNGVLWDFGGDPLQAWDQLMAVRQRALQNFSVDTLPDDRQMGEVEARLVPVYLMHRYQAEGIARLLGGGDFDYATSTDVRAGSARAGVRMVPAATQRKALDKLASSLRAETLALPANVLDLITPASTGFERGREYFATRMSGVFDPLSAAEAAAAQTCQFLFDPARLNRMAWQHARDPQQPGLREAVDTVLNRTWKRTPVAASVVGGEAVQASANWVVLDSLLRVVDGGQLHPAQHAELRQQLASLAGWLAAHATSGTTGSSRLHAAQLIRTYLEEPAKVKLRPLPAVPPGAPI